MSVTRLLVEGLALAPGRLLVPASASRHARVARVEVGEGIELVNLLGEVAVGRLIGWEGAACRVEIASVVRERGEPPAPLVLALAVLHTAAFDWAVEKATELGATAIVPVLSQRVQKGRHESRIPRWQRLAAGAVAQCGRSRAPVVQPPEALAEVVGRAEGLRLLAHAGEAEAAAAAGTGAAGVTVLVGPEGGFTDAEVEVALTAGFRRLGLGPRTLRAETAAVAALAVAQARLGWL